MSTTTSSGVTIPGQAVEPQTRRFTDAAAGGTRLGPTLRVKGSITGADSVVVIAGSVDGPIEVDGLLHILAGAHVAGPVTATDVVVEGELKARLVARGRVELRATAHVYADIHARTLAIAEGCVFDGRMHMGGESAAVPTRFREKRGRKGGRNSESSPPRSST